nr:hypothetical protein GCM10020185_55770 [Pseudomonas brassicacearum subsp. brassicacearum]
MARGLETKGAGVAGSRLVLAPQSFFPDDPLKIIRSKSFTGDRAWAALDIANMNGVTTRLHWTDQPYKWHVNDGEEVFVVLDGQVRMCYREEGVEKGNLAGGRGHFSTPRWAPNMWPGPWAKRESW